MYVCMTVCCLTPLAIGSTCQLSEIRIDNSTRVMLMLIVMSFTICDFHYIANFLQLFLNFLYIYFFICHIFFLFFTINFG